MKRKSVKKEGDKMSSVAITLEEITDFYEKYGIETSVDKECPTIPSAFEDIPLQYTISTTQHD